MNRWSAGCLLVAVSLTWPAFAEFRVNRYTANDQREPSVAGLSGGGFVVTWTSSGQDGSAEGVYGQRYDSAGNRLGREFRVNRYRANSQLRPSTAGLSDGGFVVTWMSDGQDGSGYGVYGQRYDSAGNQAGQVFRVNRFTADYQIDPSVAGLSDGGFVVTWSSSWQDGHFHGVYGQRYNSAGIRAGQEFRVNRYTANDQREPSVAGLSDGGFVVTWVSLDQDGSGYGVYGQRYDSAGGRVGREFRVNRFTTDHQNEPSVAGLSDGGFVVTWTSAGQDDSGTGIYGQRYDSAGNRAGGEFRANTETADHQALPAVAGLSDGGFVVTWTSSGQDGSISGIYGQRYDSAGNSVGDEFRINRYTEDSQLSPSVAGLSNGGFIVTWTSFGQDGSGAGVYGQRYAP